MPSRRPEWPSGMPPPVRELTMAPAMSIMDWLNTSRPSGNRRTSWGAILFKPFGLMKPAEWYGRRVITNRGYGRARQDLDQVSRFFIANSAGQPGRGHRLGDSASTFCSFSDLSTPD